MDEQRITALLTVLTDLKNSNYKNAARKLNLSLAERIIKRLGSFSSECKECDSCLIELEACILQHNEELGNLEKASIKKYKQVISSITSHLQHNHKLVTPGYYLSIYIALFLGVGMIFGMVIFDNLAAGLSIGMLFGAVIGFSLDENAKKKGLMI